VAAKHFLRFLIQKMFGGCKVFFKIIDQENAWRLLSIFYHFRSRKRLAAMCFLPFSIQKTL
jgi:hypothetical protein